MANFDFAEEHKFILAEERTFLRRSSPERPALAPTQRAAIFACET